MFRGPLLGSTVRFMEDDTNLYIGMRLVDAEFLGKDVASIRFDNTLDLRLSIDDAFQVSARTGSADMYIGPDGMGVDTAFHGDGMVTVSEGITFVEIVRPLNSGDPHDLNLGDRSSVGVCLSFRREVGRPINETTFPPLCTLVREQQVIYAELLRPG